jgi:hypothetical protein
LPGVRRGHHVLAAARDGRSLPPASSATTRPRRLTASCSSASATPTSRTAWRRLPA